MGPVPDLKTQERRDWFHGYSKAIKRATQMRARLRFYLSDNGARLKKGTRLTEPELAEELHRQARPWSGSQWRVIGICLAELRPANQQRLPMRSARTTEGRVGGRPHNASPNAKMARGCSSRVPVGNSASGPRSVFGQSSP